MNNAQTTSVDIVTITSQIDDALWATLNNVSQQSYSAINHLVIYRHASKEDIARLNSFHHQKNLSFYLQEGKGIASAFNNGIERSQGDLVLFLNSGDTLIDRDVVEKVAKSYSQNQWLWATGETISVSKRRYLKKYIKQRKTWNNSLFWYGNPVCHQSTFYTRNLIERVGLYDELLPIGMDYDFNVRSSLISKPKLLYFPIAYYDTTGVSSIKVFKQLINQRRIRKRYFQLSVLEFFRVETYCFLKAFYRLLMIPAKLWL